MNFEIGDKVIYPNHGLGQIERITTQKIAGQEIRFYELTLIENNSTVLVPINNVGNVGLRRTINKDAVKGLLLQLQAACPELTSDWKDRFRENSEKMKSGRISDVAEVLKTLASINSRKTLSFREKKMYDRAKRLLITEIAAVEEASEDAIEQQVDQALRKAIGPQLTGNA